MNSASGVVKNTFDIPVSFRGPSRWVTCLDPNNLPLAHVSGVVDVSTLATDSGVASTTSLFEIDRDNTWVLYNGLTYHIARGRPGKDDITHVITTPQGLYVETGVEPDFEVTRQSQRKAAAQLPLANRDRSERDNARLKKYWRLSLERFVAARVRG